MKGIRIIIITQVLSKIVMPILNSSHQVAGIIEAAPRYNKSWLHRSMLYRIFRFIYSFIKKKTPLRALASQRQIPYYYLHHDDEKRLELWLKKLQPDLIVIYSMSQLLGRNIFTLPKYGAINLHPSLLPKYRGPNPFFWMYYNMDLSFGITIHYIDEGEDTGDIIYHEAFDIELGTRLDEIIDYSVSEIGVKLILKAIDNIEQGVAPRYPQPKFSPTPRARNIQIPEYKSIIDWEKWSIQRIWHFLRGMEPYLNIIFEERRHFLVLNFEKCNVDKYKFAKIYEEDNKYFIACKEGKIYLSLDKTN